MKQRWSPNALSFFKKQTAGVAKLVGILSKLFGAQSLMKNGFIFIFIHSFKLLDALGIHRSARAYAEYCGYTGKCLHPYICQSASLSFLSYIKLYLCI